MSELITPLEAVEDMVEEGRAAIFKAKNDIVRAEVINRLGKRLMLRGGQFNQRIAQAQTMLENNRKILKQLEEAQSDLEAMRDDMVEETKKPAILE